MRDLVTLPQAAPTVRQRATVGQGGLQHVGLQYTVSPTPAPVSPFIKTTLIYLITVQTAALIVVIIATRITFYHSCILIVFDFTLFLNIFIRLRVGIEQS